MNKEKALKKTASNWRELLLQEDLSSDNYNYEVIQIVESNWLAIEKLYNIIKCAEESESIRIITREDLIELLKPETANTKLPKGSTPLSKNLLLAASKELVIEELISESIAALIKLKILTFKEEYVTQKEIAAKLKKQLEDELKKMRASKGKEGKDKGKKGKDKGKKGPQTMEEIYTQTHKNVDTNVSKEKDINLFTTDYEPSEKEITYYILLCKIYDYNLIEELNKLGVEVNLLIEIEADYRKGYLEEQTEEDRSVDISEEQINNYWEPWLEATSLSEVLPLNTCYLKYIPSDAIGIEENFEDFQRILMNIADFKRQYKNYYTNVRFLNVKERKKTVPLHYLTTYKSLLNRIPNESITIPFLLDSLIEEVSGRIDKNKKIIDEPIKTIKKFHGGPTQQIKNLLDKYDCKFREIPNKQKIPKTINLKYGNVLEYITSQPNVVDITLQAFKKLPPINLFEFYPTFDNTNVLFYKYIFNKWANQEIDKSVKELKQCVYSFLFKRKHYSTLDISCNKEKQTNNIELLMFTEEKTYNEDTTTQPNINSNPFDSKLASQIKNMSENQENCLCKYKIPENCECQLTENYCTLCEDLDAISLIQMLKIAQDEYKHFDYKYFAPNDVILIRFHHRVDTNGIKTEKCVNFLRTVICFRDFCAYNLQEDTDWFLKEEIEYWKENKEEERRRKEQKIQDLLNKAACDDDFIIPGSLKDKKRKESQEMKEKGKGGKGKTDNKKEPKAKKGGKDIPKIINKPIRLSDPHVPTSFPPYDSTKNYLFEIYNLGSNCVQSFDEVIDFHSIDGLSISIHKQKWDKQNLKYTFITSANNSSIIIHNFLDKVFKCETPFQFHINVANGAVMVFNKPYQKEEYNLKHVVTDTVDKKDPIDTIFSKSVSKTTYSNESGKNSFFELLKEAIKNQIPIFKIISTRLHKYQYVKRIKSPIELPVGKVLKRVLCKPTLFIRTKSKKSVQESKVIPFTELMNQQRKEINMEFKTTLPTGLQIQTVNAVIPFDFYIKQKYIIQRNDLNGIQDESYRCFCRNGTLLKFLKDGTVKTYSPDKNISHFKYGCFSSNKAKIKQIIDSLQSKKDKNILPVHFYINNTLSRLQKRIRNMCNKYKNHLIDIADNYRFESSRLECRKLHKVYKLSKKLFGASPNTIPLLNFSVITAEGRQLNVKNNIVYDQDKKYHQMEFNDYLLSETILHREDGTSWLMTTDGKSVTQFADGSRITTWAEELNELIVGQSTTFLSSSLTPSLDKYCQVDEGGSLNTSTIINEEMIVPEENSTISEDSLNVLYTTTKPEDEIFVYLGMNYKFEHPNYATVTYYCIDDTTKIKMPDKIEVKITKDGAYSVDLLNNDSVNVDENTLKINASTCPNPSCKTSCEFNIFPLIYGTDSKESDNFLYLKDSTNRVFEVNFNGEISNYISDVPENKDCFNLIHEKPNERYFVVNRDLSGEELYHSPVPFNFLHTLNLLEQELDNNQIINLQEESCLTLIQPLKKTYSEHLMMLYDIPILATTNEKKCINNLWKLHDFDINTIISKRIPIYTFKRLINRLPIEILGTLTDMLATTLAGGKFNTPDPQIVEKLVEIEKKVPAPIIVTPVVPKLSPLNSKTVKKLSERYKKLIKKGEIPKYFKTLKGMCFLNVEECSEEAMKTGAPFSVPLSSPVEENKLEQEKQEEKQIDEQFVELNVPQELTIHLKPDSYVHDIEIKSTGLRVITDKDTKDYPFPISARSLESDVIKSEVDKTGSKSSKETTEMSVKSGSTKIRSQETSDSTVDKKYIRSKAGTDVDLIKSKTKMRRISKISDRTLQNTKIKDSKSSASTELNFIQNKSKITTKIPKRKVKKDCRSPAGGDSDVMSKYPSDVTATIYTKISSSMPLPKPPANSLTDLNNTFDEFIERIELEKRKKRQKDKRKINFLHEIGIGVPNACKIHLASNPKCNDDTCMCPSPKPKKITNKKCPCKIGECFCIKSTDTEYSTINFKDLAWSILQQFDDKQEKFKLLEDNIDEVIKTAAKQLKMSINECDRLISLLKVQLPFYPKIETPKFTTEELLNILNTIKENIDKQGSGEKINLNPVEIYVISTSMHEIIIENRVGDTKSEVISNLTQKLTEFNLNPDQKLEVLNAICERMDKTKNKLIISNSFQKIIEAVNKAMEEVEKKKKPCSVKCALGILKEDDECKNPECKSRHKALKNKAEINEIFVKSDAILSESSASEKPRKTRTDTNESVKIRIGDYAKITSNEAVIEEACEKITIKQMFQKPNVYDPKIYKN